MHLTGSGVPNEPVERFAGVRHLAVSTSVHHGAEARRVHSWSGVGRGHTLGQEERGPDLQTPGRARHLAGLQGVHGLTADEDRAVLGRHGRRDDDVLHLVTRDRGSNAADDDRGRECSNGQSHRSRPKGTAASREWATLPASVHTPLQSALNRGRASSTDEAADWIPIPLSALSLAGKHLAPGERRATGRQSLPPPGPYSLPTPRERAARSGHPVRRSVTLGTCPGTNRPASSHGDTNNRGDEQT